MGWEKMARALLILFFLLPVSRMTAGKYLFVINQRQQSFICDGDKWQEYFKTIYPGIDITKLKEYKAQEAACKMQEFLNKLTKNDTLILIVSSHMIPNPGGRTGEKGCIILDASKGLPDLNSGVIWQYTWQNWIDNLDKRNVTTFFILITCKPYLVIDPIFTARKMSLTVLLATDKDYSIFTKNGGSLMAQTMASKKWKSASEFVNYAKNCWLDRSYYHFIDVTTGRNANEFYPISPVLLGKDFYF